MPFVHELADWICAFDAAGAVLEAQRQAIVQAVNHLDDAASVQDLVSPLAVR